jgi:hypothetical protein
MKRVLLTLAWTAAAYFGSRIILGLLVGFSLLCMAGAHYDPPFNIVVIGLVSRIIPALVAGAVLLLALCGRLPGLRKHA